MHYINRFTLEAKKIAVALLAASIALLGFGVLAAQPAAALSGNCTWTIGAQTVNTTAGQPVPATANAHGGQTVSASCTGINDSGILAIVYASPLAGVAVPTAAQTASGANPAQAMADILFLTFSFSGPNPPSNGNASASGALPADGSAVGGATGDPAAVCPPTQAQVNAGLTNCALAVAVIGGSGQLQESVVLVNYDDTTNPTPANPTLQVTNGGAGFVAGNSVNVADAASPTSYWWGALTQGAPNAGSGVPAPSVLIDGTTPAVSAVTASAPSYTNPNCSGNSTSTTCTGAGTLTPPALGGSFTWPSGLTAGPHGVTVIEPNLDPPGVTAGSAGFTCNGTFPTNCISASTSANQQGAPAAANISPASGQGSAGNTVSFDISPVDTQGSVICPPVFLNSNTPPASAPSTAAGCPQATDTGLGDAGTASINSSTGVLHGQIVLTNATTTGSNNIYVAWDPPSGPSQLVIPYTVSAAATTCGGIAGSGVPPAPNSPGPLLPAAAPSSGFTAASTSCTTSQIINETVTGTAAGLTQTESAAGGNTPPNVQMTTTPLNGFQQTAHGTLNTDVVQDIRGTLVGWTVSAVFQDDLLGPTVGIHRTIPVSGFNWTPAVTLDSSSPPSGYLSDITTGAATTGGFGAIAHSLPATGDTPLTTVNGTRTLCAAAPGGGGGTFDCAASLTLVVPAGVAAGDYSSVLQITIT